MYYHLDPADYSINFPAALDVVPALIQKRTYIDAGCINMLYACVQNVEQFLLDNPLPWEG
jgi:hypothetical protein